MKIEGLIPRNFKLVIVTAKLANSEEELQVYIISARNYVDAQNKAREFAMQTKDADPNKINEVMFAQYKPLIGANYPLNPVESVLERDTQIEYLLTNFITGFLNNQLSYLLEQQDGLQSTTSVGDTEEKTESKKDNVRVIGGKGKKKS